MLICTKSCNLRIEFTGIQNTLPANSPDELDGKCLDLKIRMARYALIIGIDFYKDANRLHSCVNDAVSWKSLLIDQYNFEPNNICCLTTVKDTTKENFRQRFIEFLMKLKRGDFGLFIFSGHGGRFEVERVGKKLVMEGLRSCDDVLYEDEISEIQKKYQNKSARLVSVIDACNSGGLNFCETQSTLVTSIEEKVHSAPHSSTRIKKKTDSIPQVLTPMHPTQALLLACKQMESAYGDVFHGKMKGVFTHYLIDFLRQEPKTSFKRFMDFIGNHLPDERKGYFQNPQFMGTSDNLNRRIIE